MEVEAEEEVAALKSDDFVLFVYMKELALCLKRAFGGCEA